MVKLFPKGKWNNASVNMFLSVEKTIQDATAYISASKFVEAKELLEKSAKSSPGQHYILFLLGITLRKLNKLNESITTLEKSLTINQKQEAAWGELGQSFVLVREYDKAINAFKKSIEIKANYQSSANLADIYLSLNKLPEAIHYYNESLKFTKDDYLVYRGLGEAFYKLKDMQKAFDNFLYSIKLNPNQAKINFLLGRILLNHGHVSKSVDFFINEINLGTNIPEAYFAAGETLQKIGRVNEAVKYYKQGLDLRPHKDGYSTLMHIIHHDPSATNKDFQTLTEECYQRCLLPIKKQITKNYNNFSAHDKNLNRKIRIGFFSYRFRFAAADYWALRIFQNFNKDDFEIFLYNDSQFEDQGTQEFKALNFNWKDVHALKHEEVAQLINDDQIDILVDMIGHMGSGRLELFTLKPAPVQVCWLNYYGTLGMPEMDYFIADGNVVTEQSEKFFTEMVYKMPNHFNPFTPKGLLVGAEIASSIPYEKNAYITFGAMTRFAKINNAVLDYWSQVLNNVKDSKLLFAAEAFKENEIKEQVWTYFEKQGISRERIILEIYPELKEFFLKFNEIDICLDTFPFAGGATTLDAVFMGVPTVTLAGETWVGRSGVTTFTNIGCPELIANSIEEAIEKNIELARNIERLKGYKLTLRNKILESPICDHQEYAKDFAEALKSFWREYCKE